MKLYMILGLAVLVALCQAASAQDDQAYYERSLNEGKENGADYREAADEEPQQLPHQTEEEADEEAPEVPQEADEEAPEPAETGPEADEEPEEATEKEDPGKSRGLCQEKGKSCHGWVRCCGTLFCDPDSVSCVDCIPRGSRCHLFKRRCCGGKCRWGKCR